MINSDRILTYVQIFLIFIAIILAIDLITSPKQEAFTELYFTNASAIQYKVKLNEPLHMDFTVKNHESKAVDYSYTVSVDHYQNQSLLKTFNMSSKKFSLKNNETITFSEKININELHKYRVRVSVKLYRSGVVGEYRAIHLWL